MHAFSIKNKWWQRLCAAGLLLYAGIPKAQTTEDSASEEAALLAELQAMELNKLTTLEVRLDDTFDVFDGLVQSRRITLASGETQATSRAPAGTTVITAQDIEATGAATLADVLQSIPGMYVGKGSWRQRSNYILRGMIADTESQHILFMLDGRPIKEIISSAPDIVLASNGINVRSIARIEIIRGPASAVYGADASSGVINIITKNAADINGTQSGIHIGSQSTREGWLLHGKRHGDLDVAFSLNYRNTLGPQEILTQDRQSAFDEANGTAFSFAPTAYDSRSRKISTHLNVAYGNWEIKSWFQRSRVGLNAERSTLKPSGGILQDIDSGVFSLNYNNTEVSRYLSFTGKLSATYFSANDPHRPRQAIPAGHEGFPGGLQVFTNFEEFSPRLDLDFFYSGINNHLLRFGGGYMFTDLYKVAQKLNAGINPQTGKPIPPGSPVVDVSDTLRATAPENIRKNHWWFLQDAWRFAPDWELTVGLRYDVYSDFGKTLNPRASLVWQARDNLTAKLLYGKAFLAPSLVNLFSSQAFFLGNAGLEPMDLDSQELALDYQVSKVLHFSFNIFHYHIRDRIGLVPNPNTGFGNIYINGGSQSGSGAELEMRWKPTPRTGLVVNYSHHNSTTGGADNTVAGVPSHVAYLRMDHLLRPHWYLNTQLKWAAGFKRTQSDLRENVGDHIGLDLALHYKKTGRHWNFTLGVRNLLDRDIRSPSITSLDFPDDVPMSRREYFAELRYQFQ